MCFLHRKMKEDRKPYQNLGMHKGAPVSSFIKAKILRLNMTKAENKLWGFLKNKKFHGYKFRRQHPISIYIVDFYCHELGLIIEVDGGYHKNPEMIVADISRSDLLRFQGLYLIRFTNEEVLNSIVKVLQSLNKYIGVISLASKKN